VANKSGKHVDKTHLSIDTAEQRGFIHRDYIAHCLRWTYVVKYLQAKQRYKTARVLDIGCGREVPLAKTLYSSRLIVDKYVGIDVNVLSVPDTFHTGRFPIKLFSGDFVELDLDAIGFRPTLATCFEVLEHVEPSHAIAICDHTHDLLADDGRFIMSTPNWDPRVGAAANHVNEMKHTALGSMLEFHGWYVEDVFGTFASIRDYKDILFSQYPGSEKIFRHLRDYYDVNFLAVIFAPLFPDLARNCLWVLRKRVPEDNYFFKWPDIPWTSSSQWEDLSHG